jgi:hypothetical protein
MVEDVHVGNAAVLYVAGGSLPDALLVHPHHAGGMLQRWHQPVSLVVQGIVKVKGYTFNFSKPRLPYRQVSSASPRSKLSALSALFLVHS